MAFRSVRISNPTDLSVQNQQLMIKQNGEIIKVPLEDIATITLEDPAIRLSVHVLREASIRGIMVIVCDEQHMPSGILTPFMNHSRQLQVMQLQLGLSKPFLKRIWQKIIRRKIENQARCCELLGETDAATELRTIMDAVGSGDPTNREAVAARIHFIAVFDSKFRRRNPTDWRNAALNYGYAILRAGIARVVTEYGFLPAWGIEHESELNPFNLVDDFLEPYRPIVDLFVVKWEEQDESGHHLTPPLKSGLTGLLHSSIRMNGEECSVLHSMDLMLKSYVGACRAEDVRQLVLPELIPIKRHSYE